MALWEEQSTVECRYNMVECRYNVVEYIMILHKTLQCQQQNINQTMNSRKTSYTSPSRASYGVSLVRICEKIDRIITALHCDIQVIVQWGNEHASRNEFPSFAPRKIAITLFCIHISDFIIQFIELAVCLSTCSSESELAVVRCLVFHQGLCCVWAQPMRDDFRM